MKKKLLIVFLASALAPSVWADLYNQNITAIYGGGNPSTGWTTDSGSGITLGLRAKNRTSGDTSNINGVYSYATAPATRGLWNYEFSINSGNAPLVAYDFYLAVDQDSSAGISYALANPILHWGDNSYGNAGTGSGAGVEPFNPLIDPTDYFTFPTIYTVVQNSQNITFGDYPGGAMPLEANATYDFNLYAVVKGTGVGGERLADVGITVVVGNGGAKVPDAGSTLALMGAAFVGIAGLRRKFKA